VLLPLKRSGEQYETVPVKPWVVWTWVVAFSSFARPKSVWKTRQIVEFIHEKTITLLWLNFTDDVDDFVLFIMTPADKEIFRFYITVD
jgi:hypothetical protein